MMQPDRFEDLTEEEQNWLESYLNETIQPEAFESFQHRMSESAEFRKIVRRYQCLNNSLQSLNEGEHSAAESWLEVEHSTIRSAEKKILPFPVYLPMAAVASIAFLLGLGLMHLNKGSTPVAATEETSKEFSAHGFAVIGRVFDAVWPTGTTSRNEGELLGNEAFKIISGTAEIQFFSGATMTVSGPAEIVVKSAWEAFCGEGSVRMHVPPAARGFKLLGPATEIIDLGTEFGLEVRNGQGLVEVFDGEILLSHLGEKSKSMKKGTAAGLPLNGPAIHQSIGRVQFPDANGFEQRSDDLQRSGFDQWQTHRENMAHDKRLISYYTFDRQNSNSQLIPNLALPQNPESFGTVILAETVSGRWPGLNEALEFRRPGSRVRLNMPGEFEAFTFIGWVRIDSLDRHYNALFMVDGYETGEPHWQIRNDGKMMLSIMIDDSIPHPKWPKNRFHEVYFSPPMWDLSMSGQWLHLASIFDPKKRKVSHFVNGKIISTQVIEPNYLIETLRIGNAEIGNWSKPFRKEPSFAIRNLNGRLDELAVFKEALSSEEIAELYEQSRNQIR